MTKRLFWVALLASACATAPPQSPPAALSRVETLADASLSAQVDVARGGALVGLTILDGADSRPNVVNQGDQTGREVQASLYDANHPSDAACFPCRLSCLWGWNPVQAGNACQLVSGGQLASRTAALLVVTSTPQNWNDAQGPSNIDLRATVAIVAPGVLRLDYQILNRETFTFGSDAWHELPVAYLDASFATGTYADGTQTTAVTKLTFTGGSWIALSDAAGWTVALYAPGAHPWSIGLAPTSPKPTSWLQAWQWLELDPGETGTDTAWLVVGRTLGQVRQRIDGLR